MILYTLLALLVLVLVALVVDRRLHQARIERESRELERLIEQRAAQVRWDTAYKRAMAAPPEQLREMGDRINERVHGRAAPLATTYRPSTPAPAPCPTQQLHQYLPGGIYAPAADSRSDCGSSWSSSSYSSGSSSCDSSSSSGGGE